MKTVEDKLNEKVDLVLAQLKDHPAKETLSEVISEYRGLITDYDDICVKGENRAPKVDQIVEIDNYTKHAALDMAWFLTTNVDRELVEHPYIEQDEELSVMADKASDALMALYQKLGEKILPLEEE